MVFLEGTPPPEGETLFAVTRVDPDGTVRGAHFIVSAEELSHVTDPASWQRVWFPAVHAAMQQAADVKDYRRGELAYDATGTINDDWTVTPKQI